MKNDAGLPAGMMRRLMGSETARILLCEVLLAVLILLTFSPSFRHVFRADHWKYLSYLRDTEGFLDTWKISYSLTRQTDHGDAHLFRPILYGCLALERSLFAADFRKYQAVNLALHAINTCLLFLLLHRILQAMCPTPAPAPASASRPRPRSYAFYLLPFAAAAFYAVNVPGSEMVIWIHIVAYQVWILLFLWVLLCLLDLQNGMRLGASKKTGIGCAILCMSLIYEITFPIALVVGGFAAYLEDTWKNKSKALVWFLSPLVLSAALNLADYYHWQKEIPPAGKPGAVLPLLGKTYFYLMVQPFFPELNNPQAGGRTTVPIANASANQVLFSAFGLMLAITLLSTYKAKNGSWRKKAAPWVNSMALIAFVHGLVIVTRLVMHENGIKLLWNSSYYCQFFVIYEMLACVVIASSQMAGRSAWRRFLTDCLSAALLMVALNSSSKTYQLCVTDAELSRPAVKCSREIDAFIKKEMAKGASPRIACITTDKVYFPLGNLASILEDLYPKYRATAPEEATHLMCYSDGVIVVPRDAKWESPAEPDWDYQGPDGVGLLASQGKATKR